MSRTTHSTVWDVAVVGAGPAGATAARIAAESGCSVLLLEREAIPRYKTCGGGLVGASLAALPEGADVRICDELSRVTLSMHGRRERTMPSRPPLAKMVFRSEFDAALVERAAQAGVAVRDKCLVKGVESGADRVSLRLGNGEVMHARTVVGADGSASRVARFVGVRCRQVDLALEIEVPVDSPTSRRWAGRALLEWGPFPGAFGWVFPKGDISTVGVVGSRGRPDETRRYMRDFVERQGFSGIEPLHDTGHLTRCRYADSPFAHNRAIVAGDAAGLADPWLREGISFAMRSGELAGRSAVAIAGSATRSDTEAAERDYARSVERELAAEMYASEKLAKIYFARPAVVHAALVGVPLVWRRVDDYLTGRKTIPEIVNYPGVRPLLSALAALS
ncbi:MULTISPECIES: geranylgeranyl reductase family protein [unclassified Actinopolyspora]|uniref:geranylgeranyl reductase family protein n=1 Tax=unclassified Actinopolyspora TaxID=2639451 RepID=UPI0013F604BE|nr:MULTISPECIES: geranylgeranyl reductase family protein [unclassified Actinopolyspora]NHD19305.1 geranylgeranyl reductase family protein [Actinopolyspora sp. BKK2]NHE78429.1 geranylgeranyl reductase family protein [Actinopolyspora sp. BKK1]